MPKAVPPFRFFVPLIIILALLLPERMWAQELIYPKFSLGATFDVGIPVQEFRDNLDRNGIGGSINFLYHLQNTPLRIGLDIGYIAFENETYAYSSNVGGFWRDYRLQTSIGVLNGHFLLRYMLPLKGRVSPYMEGNIGFKYFLANSQLYEVFGFEYYPVAGYTDSDDFALSYGATVGAEFRLFKSPDIAIDLRLSYLPGSSATYLVRKNPPPSNINDPIDLYEERTSPTNMLIPRIGIQFDLRSGNPQRDPTGRDQRRRR